MESSGTLLRKTFGLSWANKVTEVIIKEYNREKAFFISLLYIRKIRIITGYRENTTAVLLIDSDGVQDRHSILFQPWIRNVAISSLQ